MGGHGGAVAHCKKDLPVVSIVTSKQQWKVEGKCNGNEEIRYGQKENKPKYQKWQDELATAGGVQCIAGDEQSVADGEQHPNSDHCYYNAMNRRGEKPKKEIGNQQRSGREKEPAMPGCDEQPENGEMKAVLRR